MYITRFDPLVDPFVVISAVAELERSLIRERVVMGLQRAKAQGKRIGRPAAQLDSEELQALRDEGFSYRAMARQFGVSHPTILAAFNGK